MNHVIYGHRHGDTEVSAALRAEIEAAVKACDVRVRRGNATALRDALMERLTGTGWPPEVTIDPASKMSVTSVKDRTGLCLQTGNMSRMYADLLKLQTLYLRETIRAAVLIVATGDAARALGDNVANFTRLVRELPIFERTVTVPLLVLGVEE